METERDERKQQCIKKLGGDDLAGSVLYKWFERFEITEVTDETVREVISRCPELIDSLVLEQAYREAHEKDYDFFGNYEE